MTDPRDLYTTFHFSQSNPTGAGQGDVAALLRRVATTLDELGDIQVSDITFSSEVTGEEDDLTMTVYYEREPRRGTINDTPRTKIRTYRDPRGITSRIRRRTTVAHLPSEDKQTVRCLDSTDP